MSSSLKFLFVLFLQQSLTTICGAVSSSHFQPDITVHVDRSHPRASEAAPGTDEEPAISVSRALAIVQEFCRDKQTALVRVYPGVYRETISWNVDKKRHITLVVEAVQSGQVLISGSDVWKDWKRAKNSDIYIHHWSYNWGFAPLPSGFSKVREKITPIIRRREMVFLDGRRLRQVLTVDELNEGSFYIDEKGDLIYLVPFNGINPLTAIVEVATRDVLLDVNKSGNVTLCGLTFQHSNAALTGTAVEFSECVNINIEDCDFIQNNWRGLKIGCSENVMLSRCRSNNNGAMGIGMWQVKNLVMEDCETSQNNWRGAMGGFDRWAIAGTKLMHIHQCRITGHIAVDNLTRGFWFDNDNKDVVFEHSRLENNRLDGIFIEASQGPVVVRKCIISHNLRDGVRIANSDRVTVENNVIVDNQYGMFIAGSGRTESDWESGESFTLTNSDCRITGNHIVAELPEQRLVGSRINFFKWRTFISTLISDSNRWHHPTPERAFQIRRVYGQDTIGLEAWQTHTDQDKASVISARKFEP